MSTTRKKVCVSHADRPLAPGSKNYCKECLAANRQRQNPQPTRGFHRPQAETKDLWKRVNWLQPVEDIAASLQVTASAVLHQRPKKFRPVLYARLSPEDIRVVKWMLAQVQARKGNFSGTVVECHYTHMLDAARIVTSKLITP